MTLRGEVDAGLRSMASAGATVHLGLDDHGTCRIPLPIPRELVALDDGTLVVDVRLSPTGRFVTLSSALAAVDGGASPATWQSLLLRQHAADQVAGAGFAYDEAFGLIHAVSHWPLPTITTDEWKAWFDAFVAATFTLIDEIAAIARVDPAIVPVHPPAA